MQRNGQCLVSQFVQQTHIIDEMKPFLKNVESTLHIVEYSVENVMKGSADRIVNRFGISKYAISGIQKKANGWAVLAKERIAQTQKSSLN